MVPRYGTLGLIDTLETSEAANVFEYGLDTLGSELGILLDAHNANVADMVGPFVEFSTDRIRRYGGSFQLQMIEVDEYGAADVQKGMPAGADIGFPLRSYQVATGWTERWFKRKTPREMAWQLQAIVESDVRNVEYQLKTALFKPTNNTAYLDRLTDSTTLPLRALLNADSQAIPPNKFGEAFNGATHNHFLGRVGGALAASDISALIDTVVEHGSTGRVMLYIPRTMEATIAGFTSNFQAYLMPAVTPAPGSTADRVTGPRDEPQEIDDKAIGVWDGWVEVWVKPWMPANYVLCFVDNAPSKVLLFRTLPGAGEGDLSLLQEHEHFPLFSRHVGRDFGISVWTRHGAAILYAGNTVYAAPTFTA